MPRHDRPHPLGKVSAGPRLDLSLPNDEIHDQLMVIAKLAGTTPTQWARDALERAIAGEWVFIRRRLGIKTADDDGRNAG